MVAVTAPMPAKGKRLLAVERELRLLRKALPEAVKLSVQCALQAATLSRLLGENTALRRNEVAMRKRIADQGAELFLLRQGKA